MFKMQVEFAYFDQKCNLSLRFLTVPHNHCKGVPYETFLKELDMTEGRATGIPKILHAMKENGSPKPEFDFDDDHTYFLCRLPVHPQATMPVVPPVGTTSVPSLSQVRPN